MLPLLNRLLMITLQDELEVPYIYHIQLTFYLLCILPYSRFPHLRVFLQDSFAGGELHVVDIATYCHTDGAGKGFEDTFDLVVLVLPFSLDIEVHASGVAEALEEMEEHLGGHLADALAVEVGLPYEPGAPAEVEGYGAKAVIHREGVFSREVAGGGFPGGGGVRAETITFDAALVSKSLEECFAEGEGSVFNGVVLVHVEVTLHLDIEVDAAVLGNLLEHVVEEAEARGDLALAGAVKVHADGDIRLLRRTLHRRRPHPRIHNLSHLVPGWDS